MSRWANKVVLITGGSSGIGFALARLYAREGARLYLIARDREKLARAAATLRGDVRSPNLIQEVVADVTDPAALTEAIQSIGAAEHKIDLLINNAGVMRCGTFQAIPAEDFQLSFQTNYTGSYYATRAAWKYLVAAQGHVGFVGSVAGYIGLIGYAAYSPSKFALTGLAECLRMEGQRDGVAVSIIFPGDVQTPLLDYERIHSLPETRAINQDVKTRTADAVASIFKTKMEAGKFEIYCDGGSRFYRLLKVLFPSLFYKALDHKATQARHAQR